MPVITNQFTIDATQAVNTLNSVQSAFAAHNQAVGTVATQYANFTRSGKNASITFSQINAEGRKVTTTLKDTGKGYEAFAIKVGVASNAQRRLAADLENQRVLADSLAKRFAGLAGPNTTPTTGVPAVNPALIGANVASFARLTEAQVRAAAAANNLNKAQTDALVSAVNQSGRARVAIGALGGGVTALRSKFDELGKIAFATFIYRGLSLIQQGLTQGTRSALQYSREIGLIQTLSHNAADSFDVWNKSIRGVADSLGLPVADVATATYDALSNQVIKTSQDIGLISVAGELARNTNANVTDSLNVLSSILNSYGTEAGTAQQISDELFRTVDLGRVRINELNGVIGRSAGIAKTAGVSLRELEAGLIVQTQAGLDSAESATLLNNVFSQLIKPNDALSAQFRKMGFDSGFAAVQTLTFAGVMRKLGEAAKETDEGIATFFPEIRGLRGAATFAGEGIDKFEASLRALEQAQGANAEASKILKDNLGQGLLDEIQRIKNFFTVDFGQAVLKAIASVSQAFGGLNNIVQDLTGAFKTAVVTVGLLFATSQVIKFTGLIGTVVKAIYSMVGVVTAAEGAVLLFGASAATATFAVTAAVGGIALAFGAAYTATKYFDSFSRESAQAIAKDFADSNKKIVTDAENTATARTRAFNDSTNSMTQIYADFVATSKRANNELRSTAQDAGKTIAESLKNNFQVLSGVAREGLNKLESEQKRSADNSVRITKDRIGLTNDFEQKQFDRRLDYLQRLQENDEKTGRVPLGKRDDPLQQILKLTNARNDLLRGREAKAINLGDLDTAKKSLDEIQANLDHLDSLRDKQGNTQIIGINKASAGELQFYLDGTAKLNAMNQTRTVELAKQIQQEKQQVKNIDDILNKTATFASKKVFDKNGDLLPKFVDDADAANKELIGLQQSAIAAAGKLKGVTDPLVLVQYNAALKEIEKTFGEQRANLALQVQQALTDQALTKSSQQHTENANIQKNAVAELTTALKDQQLVVDQNLLKVKTLAEAIRSQAAQPGSSASLINRLLNPTSGFSDKNTAQLNELVNGLDNTLKQPGEKDINFAKAQLEDIFKLVSAVAPNLKFINPEDNKELLTYTDGLTKMGQLLNTLAAEQGKTAAFAQDLTKQEEAARLLNLEFVTFLRQASPGLTSLQPKIDALGNSATALTGTAKSFDALSRSIAGLSKEVEAFNKLTIPGTNIALPTANRSEQTVPAPNNRITDLIAPQAQRAVQINTQLNALNSSRPAPVQTAAPVTNNNSVEANITVNAEKSMDVYSFAREVQRGIDAGTIKLRPSSR